MRVSHYLTMRQSATHVVCLIVCLAGSASGQAGEAEAPPRPAQSGMLATWHHRAYIPPVDACVGQSTAPGRPHKPRKQKPGDIDRGSSPPHRYKMNPWIRSGGADEVGWWARVPSSHKNRVGIVGGGATRLGRAATTTEGTWGWDYRLWHHRSFSTSWTWFGRSQGGEGAYATDHH